MMTPYHIERITPENAAAVAADIGRHARDFDAAECRAIGMTPEEAIAMSIGNSVTAYAFREEGAEYGGAWGTIPSSLIGKGPAQLWMISTDVAARRPRVVLTESRKFVLQEAAAFGVLEAFPLVEYAKSIRWLQRLGFTMQGKVMIGNGWFYHAIRMP